jgi:hypothetical protein
MIYALVVCILSVKDAKIGTIPIGSITTKRVIPAFTTLIPNSLLRFRHHLTGFRYYSISIR